MKSLFWLANNLTTAVVLLCYMGLCCPQILWITLCVTLF